MLLQKPVFSSLLILSFLLLHISSAIRVSSAHSDSTSRAIGLQAGSLGRFSSVELRNGGKVFLRHGKTQRVTLLKGSSVYTQIAIAGEDRLVIDKCKNDCPRGYELEIEIVTPDISIVSIADGGTIEVLDSFPPRKEIRVAVSQGGTIDIRTLTVDSVTASVDQGGKILTKPQSAMIASVRQGGNITYWGDARVRSSVRDGGVVTKGTAEDADKPLSALSDSFQVVPVIPPLPPTQVQRPKTVN